MTCESFGVFLFPQKRLKTLLIGHFLNKGNNKFKNQLNFNAPPITGYEDEDGNDNPRPLELPKHISDNLLYKFDYTHSPASVYDGSTATTPSSKLQNLNAKYDRKRKAAQLAKLNTRLTVFKVKTQEINKLLLKHSEAQAQNDALFTFTDSSGSQISYDLYRANIVWDLGDPFEEDVAANRFQDNDELRFSLRSLEKYAPWIRHIYIVTNGQRPHWLNLSHPKVSLITHEQIFANKSHLPTFSSPSIETNIHRIPGLSRRFLYFNDDLLLGSPVWPDDFFTFSKGFRFHLAWSLPGCNLNCPVRI